MKRYAFLLLLLNFADVPHESPSLASFRYIRSIEPAPAGTNVHTATTCVVLDAGVFAHAAPSLDDIRVLGAGGQENPYAVTMSQTSASAEPARVLNLGLKSPRHISFDLRMPNRAYSSVDLDLNAQNFLGSARLTGLRSLADKSPVYLGEYSIFDLTSQRLGRSTHLNFSEATFPYLHLDLVLAPAPRNDGFDVKAEMVTGAEVPASRIAQTLYTQVAESSSFTAEKGRTLTGFTVPAHVPVERVSFELDPAYTTNFDRTVTITARAISSSKPSEQNSDDQNPEERLSGQISRVHMAQSGQEIREQSLTVPAILGANAKEAATIEVAVENGDDQPVRLRAVRLEMRQRKLCFPDAGEAAAELVYGGEQVKAPVYDFSRLFHAGDATRVAALAPEALNPAYKPVVAKRSFTEAHPGLLWVVLLGVILVLGTIAFRSAKRM